MFCLYSVISCKISSCFFFILGYEVENINNVTDAPAPATVPPVNLSSLAPQPRDELQLPESARSTLSGHSWITDDKWSDDEDDDAAAAGRFMAGAPASRVAPPVAVLDGHVAAGNASHGLNRQVGRCKNYNVS